MALRLVLVAPPGGGKSRQARALAARLSVLHVSTGDALRDEVAGATPLGLRVQRFLEAGDLVPDELVTAVLAGRLQDSAGAVGFVLDGFPRTHGQALLLDEILGDRKVERVVLLVVPEEEVVRRLGGRRVCPAGHPYHVESDPPKVAGRCDVDGLPLQARPDDRPAVIAERLVVYRRETTPMLSDYRDRSLLIEVDGLGSIEEVRDRILRALSRSSA
jgi:adenylate kinase